MKDVQNGERSPTEVNPVSLILDFFRVILDVKPAAFSDHFRAVFGYVFLGPFSGRFWVVFGSFRMVLGSFCTILIFFSFFFGVVVIATSFLSSSWPSTSSSPSSMSAAESNNSRV